MQLKNICWGIFLLLGTTLLQGQSDTLSYQVLAAYRSGKIYLRWAPASPATWQRGRTQGYVLERYTLLAPGSSTPVADVRSTKVALVNNYKPAPLATFEALALDSTSVQGQMAGVAGAALYETSFEMPLQGGALTQALNTTQETENRYGLMLLASDASFEIAKAAALGWVDSTTQAGATYIYRVVPSSGVNDPALGGTVRVLAAEDSGLSTPPPSPEVLNGDRTALLSWTQEVHYSGYAVERSTDGGLTYVTRSKGLVLAIEQNGKAGQVYFTDSLPSNDLTCLYRIRGQTPFGFLGAPSAAIPVKGEEPSPVPPPYLQRLEELGTTQIQVRLTWRFPAANREFIQGFRLYRSVLAEGPFQQIGDLFAPTDSVYVDANPLSTAYYQIRALTFKEEEVPSLSRLLQLKDETPPAVPSGLKGTMQKDGTVQLSWTANTDPDLLGYRVFYAQSRPGPYVQLTSTPIESSSFGHRLDNKSLADSVFFKISALDQRQNSSAESSELYVPVADANPPAQPSIIMLDPYRNGVKITWEGSASKDAIHYEIQRKGATQPEWSSILNKDSTITGIRINYDSTLTGAYEWSYRIAVRDDAGLESYSAVVSIKPPGAMRNPVENILVETSTQGNAYAAKLSWDYLDDDGVSSFVVYRQMGNEPMVQVATLFRDKLEPIPGAAAGQIRYTWKDSQVDLGKQYKYVLQAKYFDGGTSPLSVAKNISF
ncbi:fibronectin type III domain-containing protein [Haliscomenobacter sp.]|uniref:fibronectin type III domain-containing protein n=1 Tax=Haliscomenobacter sp. TaxID=2717303 RepID=UPI002D1FBA60|nr:fibronectin type III domain-containing protein [Haliscomenobacter sp.]